MKRKPLEKILKISIGIIFLLALIFVIRQFFFSASGTYALIYQDNVVKCKIKL